MQIPVRESIFGSGSAWGGWVLTVVGVVMITGQSVVGIQDDPPTLDELLEITPPGQPAGVGTAPEGHNDPEIDPQVTRALSGSDPGDVFDQAVRQMGQAADRLNRDHDVGLATQRLQQEIIAKLDQVIAAARQQQSKGGASGSSGQARQQQGGSAANASQQSIGGSQAATGQAASPGGAPIGGRDQPDQANGSMQGNRTEWGNLPARLRDELQQGINERYSSLYRQATGAYYRRLAQEGD